MPSPLYSWSYSSIWPRSPASSLIGMRLVPPNFLETASQPATAQAHAMSTRMYAISPDHLPARQPSIAHGTCADPGVHDMPITHRFGKRIPLPSTRQTRHELIVMFPPP